MTTGATPTSPTPRIPFPLLTGDVTNATTKAHTADWFISYISTDTDTATAVNGPYSGIPPDGIYTFLNYEDPSVNFDQVKKGMTVRVGSAPGGDDFGQYRIREDPLGDGVLQLMEMGYADPGRLRLADRLKGFQDIGLGAPSPDYITVSLMERDIWAALPKIVYTGGSETTLGTGTFYVDYNHAWDGETAFPVPMARLGPHRSTWVGDPFYGPTKSQFSFNPFLASWISAGNYHLVWTLPDAADDITGTLDNTAGLAGDYAGNGVTFTLPYGLHILRLDVGQEALYGPHTGEEVFATLYRYIWVHDKELFPPIRPIAVTNHTINRTGASMSFTLADNDINLMRDGTMINAWQDAKWGGARISYVQNCFTGWSERESYRSRIGTHDTEINVVGPAEMLSRLPSQSNYLSWAIAPSTWVETHPQLVSPEFIAWLTLKYRSANALELFDYWSYYESWVLESTLPEFMVPQGSLFAQLQNTLGRQNLLVGCDQTGAFWVRQHPSRIVFDQRDDAVPVRITLTDAMWQTINLNREMLLSAGKVSSNGFAYDFDLTERVMPLMSVAPAELTGQGVGEIVEADMMVYGQDDLNRRCGNDFAMANNPMPSIDIDLPGNWCFFDPAWLHRILLTIPAEYMHNGVPFSHYVIPNSVSYTHNVDGTIDTHLNAELETVGVAGLTKIIGDHISIHPPPPPPPPPPPGTDFCEPESFSALWTVLPVTPIAVDGHADYPASMVPSVASAPSALMVRGGPHGPSYEMKAGAQYLFASERVVERFGGYIYLEPIAGTSADERPSDYQLNTLNEDLSVKHQLHVVMTLPDTLDVAAGWIQIEFDLVSHDIDWEKCFGIEVIHFSSYDSADWRSCLSGCYFCTA